MKQLSLVLLCAALLCILAVPAEAQATRTWVSGVGDDLNPCSRTAPCKTFAGAISKTAKDGEISALDPAGFGALTISKSITINGDGTLAGILNNLVNGIVINITDPLDVRKTVVIRNVSINGAGNTNTGGLDGIRILAANQVTIDNVTISNQSQEGIEIASAGNVNVTIKNTRIDRVSTGVKINCSTGGSLAKVTMDGVLTSSAILSGVEVASNSRAVISNSVFTRGQNGILLSQASAVADLDNSVLSHNTGAGVAVNISGSTARLSRNAFFENGIGINIAAGGVAQSSADNVFGGNGANGAPNGALVKQ